MLAQCESGPERSLEPSEPEKMPCRAEKELEPVISPPEQTGKLSVRGTEL